MTDNNVEGGEWGGRGRYHCGTLFAVSYDTVRRKQTMAYAQTKRWDDHLRCGDDVDALGLGVAMILMMLGAISTPRHGRTMFWAYCDAEVGYLPYVGPTYGLV